MLAPRSNTGWMRIGVASRTWAKSLRSTTAPVVGEVVGVRPQLHWLIEAPLGPIQMLPEYPGILGVPNLPRRPGATG
jgi:hypothetical protein